ncbi:hypothetical protein [Geodermatophilus sp. SYSU D00684]
MINPYSARALRDASPVIYWATTALPYDDRERATAGLRGQLRLMAFADGVTPDWSELTVEGPTEAVGRHDVVWFEWTATVAVGGQVELSDGQPSEVGDG